jgi:hypothetical protein
MIFADQCRGPHCKRKIVKIKMFTGKWMPCEPGIIAVADHPEYEGKKLVLGSGVIVTAERDTIGFEPHWGNCPDAKKFKEKKRENVHRY